MTLPVPSSEPSQSFVQYRGLLTFAVWNFNEGCRVGRYPRSLLNVEKEGFGRTVELIYNTGAVKD